MNLFKTVLFMPAVVVVGQLSSAVAMADNDVTPPDISTRAPTCHRECQTRQVCHIEQTGTKHICMPSEPEPTCVDTPVTGRVCHDEEDCHDVCE
jgi:hypothetical protein